MLDISLLMSATCGFTITSPSPKTICENVSPKFSTKTKDCVEFRERKLDQNKFLFGVLQATSYNVNC